MNTNMTRIAVLVSGGGTNLQALIDAQARGELGNGKITLVIASKPGVYALERAANAGIESMVLARKEYGSIAEYSKALADALESAGIDLVVLAGFLTIIDEQVYERFPNRILNVHPALIPSFCGKGYYGLHVHEEALKKGVRVSGATVHIVTPECDAGPIVLQKAVEEHHLIDDVTLAGSFCIGKCNRVGVTVQVDDDVHVGVTKENFKEFFKENVLDKLGKE